MHSTCQGKVQASFSEFQKTDRDSLQDAAAHNCDRNVPYSLCVPSTADHLTHAPVWTREMGQA